MTYPKSPMCRLRAAIDSISALVSITLLGETLVRTRLLGHWSTRMPLRCAHAHNTTLRRAVAGQDGPDEHEACYAHPVAKLTSCLQLGAILIGGSMRLVLMSALCVALTGCPAATSLRSIRTLGEPTIGPDGTAWVVGIDNTQSSDSVDRVDAESVFVIFCHADRVPQCVRVSPEQREMNALWTRAGIAAPPASPGMGAPATQPAPTSPTHDATQ